MKYIIRAYLKDQYFEQEHETELSEDKFCDHMDYMYTDERYGDPYYIAEQLALPEPKDDMDKDYFLDKLVMIREDKTERVIFE